MFAKNTPFWQNINLKSSVIDGFYLFLKVFISILYRGVFGYFIGLIMPWSAMVSELTNFAFSFHLFTEPIFIRHVFSRRFAFSRA